VVRPVEHGLVDVDDGHTCMEGGDVLRSRELPLQLAPELVVDGHDGLDHAVA
jgi:hypothetical protein